MNAELDTRRWIEVVLKVVRISTCCGVIRFVNGCKVITCAKIIIMIGARVICVRICVECGFGIR